MGLLTTLVMESESADSEEVAEDHGAEHDAQAHALGADGINQTLLEELPAGRLPAKNQPDDERAERPHAAGLIGRKDAGVQAADHQNHEQDYTPYTGE